MTKTKRIVFLSGEKVDLVIIEENDIQKVTKWINDQESTQFLMVHKPMSKNKETGWFERISKSESEITLGISTKKGKLIGNISLCEISLKDRNAVHGIFIGDKKYWGGGYGTEAGMLLFKYGFESLGLNKINSSLISYNKRSLRYHVGCGFKIAGRLKKQFFKKGKFHDQVLVDLFPKDFKKSWKKFKSSK